MQKGKIGERRILREVVEPLWKAWPIKTGYLCSVHFCGRKRCFWLKGFDSGGRSGYFAFISAGRGYESRMDQVFVRGNDIIQAEEDD